MSTLFGKNSKGEEVYLYTLKNENGMQVSFLNLGAAVHEIYVPAKSGEQVQVSAIYDNPLSYEHQTTYFGAIVAPYANRIANAKFEIDGESVNNLNGALSVGRGLDRSMGINLELDTTNYDETQLVTLYFVTDDSQEGLLVPVTRLISASTDPITYAVSALIQGPVNENYISVFDQNTTLLSEPVVSEGLISLNFSKELYYDSEQTKVSSMMLTQLVMTLTELEDIEMVSVSINGNIKVMDEADHSIAVPTGRFDVSSLIEAQ